MDLLKVPEDVEVIRAAIWDGLVDALDVAAYNPPLGRSLGK
jgi:hypothetical protein